MPTYNITYQPSPTLQLIDGRVILTLRLQDTAAATAVAAAATAVAAAASIESIEQDIGNISGAISINLLLGTLIIANLTAGITPSFSGLPPVGRRTAFSLLFSGGVQSITWPVGTLFLEGIEPQTAGALYEIPCVVNSAGILTVYGSLNYIQTA